MKSEIFNGPRFLSYLKYDLTRMWRTHMKAAIVIGLMGLFGYFISVLFSLIAGQGWSGPGLSARWSLLLAAIVVLQLYQTRTYGHLTDKREGSAFLMLPASTTEKWLSMMLHTLVVVPLLFLVAAFGVDALLTLLDPSLGMSMAASVFQSDILSLFAEFSEEMPVGLLLSMFIASFCTNFLFFLLCGVCFKKRKIAWAFLIILGISILLPIFVQPLTGSVDIENWSEARHFLTGLSVALWLIAAALAGGIFYRVKTLKH